MSGKFRRRKSSPRPWCGSPRQRQRRPAAGTNCHHGQLLRGCPGHAERITATKPRFIPAWHDLGTVLKELHLYDEAVSALDQALAMEPDNALTHYYHGAALAMAARPQQAVESYRKAVTLDPKLPGAHLGLGHVLKTVGDQEGGIEAYRRAIELRPNFGETYYSLANLKTYRFGTDEIEDMRTRLANTELPVECRVHFAFSLGKAFEDQKDYDDAPNTTPGQPVAGYHRLRPEPR